MNSVDILLACVALILIAMNAVIALAETALTRMSLVKALTLQDQGRRGARTLARLMEHPEGWLNPLLFVNLVCSNSRPPVTEKRSVIRVVKSVSRP